MHESGGKLHVLLPASPGWQQALVMPAVAHHAEGVALDQRISSCILWLELPSGRIAGLLFKSRTPFLGQRALELIADRLESARNGELEKVPHHLSKLMGWLTCSFAAEDDLQEIAEELVREEVRRCKAWNHQYLLVDESVRRLAQPYLELFCEGLQQFAAGLDQEALHLSGLSDNTGIPDVQSYNYLFHPINRISTYRRQAMQAVPLLARALPASSTEHRIRRLQQSVDSGNPMLPALADYFRCTKNLARLLSVKDYTLIGNEWKGQLDQLTSLLSSIKPDFWPKSADDWHHLNQWLRPVYATLHNNRNHRWHQVAENGMNELAREGYGQIIPRMERHGVTLADIITFPDFVRDLEKWGQQRGGASTGTDKALQQYSLLRLAQLSRRWHRWQIQMEGLDPDESQGCTRLAATGGWLTFIDQPWEKRIMFNGSYLVVPLDTPALLQEEGQRMKHCVGGYAGICRNCGSHIFSIRDATTGSSLSTVELRFGIHDSSASDISVLQHYGSHNNQPSETCKSVLQSFLSHLRQVPAERFKKIKKELHARNQLREAEMLASQTWPSEKMESFRELLRGYSALEEIGQVKCV